MREVKKEITVYVTTCKDCGCDIEVRDKYVGSVACNMCRETARKSYINTAVSKANESMEGAIITCINMHGTTIESIEFDKGTISGVIYPDDSDADLEYDLT